MSAKKKKLCDNAENNTVVATADSNKPNKLLIGVDRYKASKTGATRAKKGIGQKLWKKTTNDYKDARRSNAIVAAFLAHNLQLIMSMED